MKPKQPFAGIKYLILSVVSIALSLPVAGALSGITVYFAPAQWDEVGVGWSTAFLSFFAMSFLGLVFLVLGFIKGDQNTRVMCCIFVTLGVAVILVSWLMSYW